MTPGFLGKIQSAYARGAAIIVEAHILRDQLADTRDDARRRQLLGTYNALPKAQTSTAGFVLDVSRLGGARLGDESTSGLLIQMKTAGRGGMQDALIALTASGHTDALVTEDVELAKKAATAKVRCEVWSFADFRRYIEIDRQ